MTLETFIERVHKIHDNKYDYSKVESIHSKDKVCIICPIHGEFWQLPHNHLKGQGCPKCGLENRKRKRSKTTEQFIEEARKIHGDKYGYSKTEYINNRIKVCIICPIHGEFWQIPADHIKNKAGCPKCKTEVLRKTFQHNNELFIRKSKDVHGNKYDYSKVEYKNNKEKVCIICPEHGEFWMMPTNHYYGKQGCPKCSGQGLNTTEIIERFRKVHGNKYDYSKVEYRNHNEKVCIICPIHGEFWQTPHKHYNGRGCPICRESKLEEEIRIYLSENNINFETHYKPTWLNKLELDFYLPDYNVGIECQGEQHFEPVSFGNADGLDVNERFAKQVERDVLKLKLCKENIDGLYYFSNKKSDTFLTEKMYSKKEKMFKEIFKNNKRGKS